MTRESLNRTLDEPTKESVKLAFGQLAKHLPGYRPRRSQNAMVGASARALASTGGRAVVEAPTGTGKSMAYLTAGIPIALAQGKRLVISTGTVALQEQICNRDIPAFLRATGLTASVALAKGRSRWACTHRLMELKGGNAQDQDDLVETIEPAGWSRPPRTGELDLVRELASAMTRHQWDGDLDNPPAPIPELLRPMLSMPHGGCMGKRCAFYRECPATLAREEAKQADVVVTNHDLLLRSLMQSLESDNQASALGDTSDSLYVIDEGHGLADAAVGTSTREVRLGSLIKRLGKLRKLVGSIYRTTGVTEIHGKSMQDAEGLLADLIDNLQTMHDVIASDWVPEPGQREPIFRQHLGRLPEHWVPFADVNRVASIALSLWLLRASVEVRREEIERKVQDKLLQQLGFASEMVSAQLALWRAWSAPDVHGAPLARWVSMDAAGELVCHAAEVSAAQTLRELLWDQAGSVLLTSATLSTAGDFGYLADEIGAPEHTEFVSLPSPFNLAEQAVLQVPAFPVLPDAATYPQAVAAWLATDLDWSAGSLVLFTSRKKMQEAAAGLPAHLRARVRMQGERAKQLLLDEHARAIRGGEGSVLFGLLSWGEGLDLPGELVSTVVVTSIPFSVPTDPIGATRAEWFESEGRNAFSELALPAAMRLLTQFAGRLVRTESDTGRIVVLDRRLVQRRYGKTILDALPPFRRDISAA